MQQGERVVGYSARQCRLYMPYMRDAQAACLLLLKARRVMKDIYRALQEC